MDIKYRLQDKPTMPQAQDHNDRYITVPAITSNDNFWPKREMTNNVRYKINDKEYQNSFIQKPILRPDMKHYVM